MTSKISIDLWPLNQRLKITEQWQIPLSFTRILLKRDSVVIWKWKKRNIFLLYFSYIGFLVPGYTSMVEGKKKKETNNIARFTIISIILSIASHLCLNWWIFWQLLMSSLKISFGPFSCLDSLGLQKAAWTCRTEGNCRVLWKRAQSPLWRAGPRKHYTVSPFLQPQHKCWVFQSCTTYWYTHIVRQ